MGEGKESAIFRIKGLIPGASGNAGGEIDMDAPEDSSPSTNGEITLGISIEGAESVAMQMAALPSRGTQEHSTSSSNALVLASRVNQKPDALVLAQRIIKNAFNFLASFSGNTSGGIEVVPLKAFEEWWRKFEGRVRSDPGFLERDGD